MTMSDRMRYNSRASKNPDGRMSYDPASDFVVSHNYVDEHSEAEFIEIQPEDSASHQGDNTFVYQRMGNADVMRMEPSQPQIHPSNQQKYDAFDKMVRRSSSEPRLNDSEMERPVAARNGSKSMVNFPSQNHHAVGDMMRRNAESNRNWQQFHHKYVQSPILEETDSALERELLTGSARLGLGSGYYIHQNPALLDYSKYHGVVRNDRHSLQNSSTEAEKAHNWQHPDSSTPKLRRSLIMERDLPFFDNRSSFLRHRSYLNRNSKSNSDKSIDGKFKGGNSKPVRVGSIEAADETESSGNEHPHGAARFGRVHPIQAGNKRLAAADDDLDSGIALNSTLRDASRRSKYLEKKSIFTIAYDDMATTKIPSASDHQPS